MQYFLNEDGEKTLKEYRIGKIFSLHKTKHLMWFRLFDGWGMEALKNNLPEFFFYHRGGVNIFGWRINILKP